MEKASESVKPLYIHNVAWMPADPRIHHCCSSFSCDVGEVGHVIVAFFAGVLDTTIMLRHVKELVRGQQNADNIMQLFKYRVDSTDTIAMTMGMLEIIFFMLLRHVAK